MCVFKLMHNVCLMNVLYHLTITLRKDNHVIFYLFNESWWKPSLQIYVSNATAQKLAGEIVEYRGNAHLNNLTDLVKNTSKTAAVHVIQFFVLCGCLKCFQSNGRKGAISLFSLAFSWLVVKRSCLLLLFYISYFYISVTILAQLFYF